jgi:uncharacterized caspase-like protein
MTFWDVADNQRGGTFHDGQMRTNTQDSLVLDSWRHRQVANAHEVPSSSLGMHPGMRGLGAMGTFNGSTFDGAMSSLTEQMERNRGISSGGPSPIYGKANEPQSHPSSLVSQRVNLGNLHLSEGGGGIAGLPLNGHPNTVLQQHKTVAEMSSRRRDAVKASFRRIDTHGQGFTTMQELASALSRYSNLNSADQQRVLQGIAGNSPHRISFAMFLGYYDMLGSTIERDVEFEDVMRHHWGFPEVCDILDDMKNKFMMVGLAYTFRKGLDRNGHPELSMEAFQEAISQVGMAYSSNDVRRVFDAFDMAGGGAGSPTLEVLKLTSHLTSAPRPQTPLPALYGTAHFSEVNSQTSGQPELPTTPLHSPMFSHKQSPGVGHSRDLQLSGEPSEPSLAPSEWPEILEHDNPNAPPPRAPPEEEEDGILAPPEGSGNPNEPAPEAPPEDDEGVQLPEEKRAKDVDDVLAPAERFGGASASNAGYGYGYSRNSSPIPDRNGSPIPGYSNLGIGGGSYGGGSYGSTAKQSHLAAAAAAGNARPAGRRRAVTVGINYIGTRNQLSGCINDSDTFIKLLTEEFGYQVSDIRQLRDDHPQRMPTRKNMIAALNWLVNGARSGDHLFFHYSGHGSQQRDSSGDEMDGKDETLVPCDFQHHGMLSDDDLRRMLVLSLPKGVRLTVILDCCHSGTGMDLPYKFKLEPDGKTASLKKKSSFRMPKLSAADVVMISGCMDTQTSADIGAGSAGNQAAAGAMTTAFKTVIEAHATGDYYTIIHQMRVFLQGRGFKQVPQLSSEHFLNLSECFMPEVQMQIPDPPQPMRPPVRKALTIGINYLTLWPGRGRLSGCINDSETMVGILKDTFGFQDNQISKLRDDRANMMPTKANILSQIQWLAQGAQNGDEMFLHYSGHGGQTEDRRGDERDGKDETILPCDFQTAGQITHDDLHRLVVDSLPQGSRMWIIMDCCHSGTVLDLEYKVTMNADGSCSCKRKSDIGRTGGSSIDARQKGEVIMISGCKDTQTSADIGVGSSGVAKAAGAMTTAFRHSINQQVTCEELLVRMRHYLKRNNFDQVPQMGSDIFIQMDQSFVDYQSRKRGKRELPTSRAISSGIANAMSPSLELGSQGAAMSRSGMEQMQDDHVFGNRLNRLESEIQRLRQQAPLSPQMSVGSPMMATGGSTPMGGAMSMGNQHMLPPGPNLNWSGAAHMGPSM